MNLITGRSWWSSDADQRRVTDAIRVFSQSATAAIAKARVREDEIHDCDSYDMPAIVVATVREYRQPDAVGLGTSGCD